MEIALVSVANKSIENREKVNFTDFRKIEFQTLLQRYHIEQCIILSTCNRSEVYAFASKENLQKLKELYMSFFAIDEENIVFLKQVFAVQHILQVACGLKSSILGEDQIFKQVKDAYQFACVHQVISKQVHVVFQNLFHIVKQIKQTYRLSEHPRSTSYVAMKLLHKQIELEHASYLVCGGGQISKQCLPYIAQAKTIYVALRDMDKLEQLQTLVPQIQGIPFEKRYEYFQQVDVLITATSSPHIVFKQEDVLACDKEQWILDLALPRDVQETLYDYPQLHIWNIDDVQSVVDQHNQIKHSVLHEIEALIIQKAQSLYEVGMREEDKQIKYCKQQVRGSIQH